MFSQDIDAASAVAIGFQLYSQKHAERGLNCHTSHRVLHGISLNFVMFRMSMFEVSPMCFGVSFVRQRFGGAAPVAEIAAGVTDSPSVPPPRAHLSTLAGFTYDKTATENGNTDAKLRCTRSRIVSF